MSLKPPKKSDLGKSWMKNRRDKARMIQPEYHLIASEGTETEPQYFGAIQRIINSKYRDRIQLKVEGIGDNTVNLLMKARQYVQNNGIVFKHVWIVYDTDDFPAENIDMVAQLCEEYSAQGETIYHAVWSNQCVELWYLLHFMYMDTDIDRFRYWPKLSDWLKNIGAGSYEKNRPDMYEVLRPYMDIAIANQLVVKSKALRKPLSRSYFNQVGKDVPLYNGVDTWFERVNQYGEENGIEVHHYIISSGLKEIIEGSNIARYFSRVYASSYLYSADGVAEWPAQAVNYTNKTQFIFRIAKGIFEEYDERVNDSVPESALVTPYENIVYIGDSATDIPCMRLVKSKGGYSIGVFDPEKNKREKVYQLFNDGRINFYAPADYSEDSELFKYIKLVIGQISINERVKTEQRTLKNSAEAYNLYITMQSLADHMKSAVSPREYQKLQRELNKLQHQIEGI